MTLEERFPGREKQIQLFRNIFSGNEEESTFKPQSVFICGQPSTGKSSLLKAFLQQEEFPANNTAFINCVECYTPRMLFEQAIDQWSGFSKTDYLTACKVDNIHQFVCYIRDGLMINKNEKEYRVEIGKEQTNYLVLDRAERLRTMPPTILPSLLRLAELTERNITVILISNIVFEKFRSKGGSMEPYIVRFPEYTKDDTLKILQLDFTPSHVKIGESDNEEGDSDDIMEEESVFLDHEFYLGFLEVIYSIFNHNCKDINELRYFAALLFPLYIKPIESGRVKPSEKAKLFKQAQPYFSQATDKLYLREISSAEWSKETSQLKDDSDDEDKRFLTKRGAERAEFELPHYTKFLLIASYLASYNPPRFDVRYFAKASEERKKKKGGGTRKGRVDKLGGKMRQQLLGPKAFPVERMLAIFYSIIEEPLEDTIDIQSQITSLTTLRLLIRTTTMDRLDGAKYKSNVNFDFIRAVARTVRFEVDKYLYDFC